MKRKFLILLLSGAALVLSCSRADIELPGNSISFKPVAAKSTKAIINGTTYPTDQTFAVSAYHNGSAEYFADLTASYSPGIALWETSVSQYWPLGGSLTFVAFSPSTAGASITSAGVSLTGYVDSTAAQMATDLCYATYTVADCAAHPASVPLTFSHALAQVVFRVKAAAYYGSNVSLAMNSLSITGINSTGDFSSAASPMWSNQATARTYPLSSSATAMTYGEGNAPDAIDVCSNLFIPQSISADARIIVGYSVTQNVSSVDYTLTNAPVSIPLRGTVTQWEPGKKYIYTLNIGMDAITFTATASDWNEIDGGFVVQ